MNKNKLFLIVQSVLCVLLTVLLAAAAIRLCREGLVWKETDSLHWIFTREKAVAALRPLLPLLALSLVMTVAGLFLDIRDENAEKPGKDTESLRDLTVSRMAVERAEMKAENNSGAQQKAKKKPPAGKIRLLRAVLLVLAAILIIAGVFNGSAGDVFGKAVKICTECVGLG
ncbi:MAG: hypothetical protein IJQ02_08330 [Oscillospiraceae bacterium]|nr:hypothetical protein [Oscillospiraceae bacterium]